MCTRVRTLLNALIRLASYPVEGYRYHQVKRLAQQGDEQALYRLGCRHEKCQRAGNDNLMVAYRFYAMSSQRGYHPARQKLEWLEAILPYPLLMRAKEQTAPDLGHQSSG